MGEMAPKSHPPSGDSAGVYSRCARWTCPGVPLEHLPVLPVGDKGVSIGSSLGRIWDLHPGRFGGAMSPPPPPTWSHQQLCPRRIIATPGRLVHVAVEMKLKLHTVEYVVFDEADRSAGCRGGVPGAGSVPACGVSDGGERGAPRGWQGWAQRDRTGVAMSRVPSPAGFSRWALPSSSRRSSPGSRTATRPSSSPPRCPSCSLSLPGPVRSMGQTAAGGRVGAGPGGNPGTGTWHGPAAGLSPGLVKPGWAERVSPSREVGLVPVAHLMCDPHLACHHVPQVSPSRC